MQKLACVVLVIMVVMASSQSVRAAEAAGDMETVRGRFIDLLRTSPKDADVESLLSKQKSDGSFGNLNYADTLVNDAWQPQLHLKNLLVMTSAYVSPGGEFLGSAELQKSILSGVDYWLKNDIKNKNWFWNEIGVPASLARISLVFWGQYSEPQKTKALEIIGRAKLGGSGTNLVWLSEIVALRGVLQNDPTLVKSAFDKIAGEIRTVKQDGPQVDGSFTFHGPLLYTWGYGSYYLRDNAQLSAVVAGTAFAFPPEKLKKIVGWTLDGAQWMSRGIGADFGAFGRETGRQGKDAKILAAIGKNLQLSRLGREDELTAMIARVNRDPAARPLIGNKQFWRADIMVEQQPTYYASSRMYSDRTKNTEWGNGEALENFYIADGCNILMKDGREYFDIFPVLDWQRIPGTTVELIPNFGPIADKSDYAAPDAFTPSRNSIVHKTKETFVGGVSNGTFGVSGGKFSRDELHVNKSWFFFDDEYVCLGSGLDCDSDDDVITTLNQTFLRGDVAVRDGDAVQEHIAAGLHDFKQLRWALHDSVGYLFAEPTHVVVANGPQSGSWHDISNAYPPDVTTHNVFKAWIDHGPHASAATYAYTVLPVADAKRLQEELKTPAAVIIGNTPELQSVWEAKSRRGGAIFYSPGTVEFRSGLKVSVDQAVMLLLSDTDAGDAVTVASPDQQTAPVHVRVERDSKIGEIDLKMPAGDMAGSSISETVKPQ